MSKRQDDRERRPCVPGCCCDEHWQPDPAAERAAHAWWITVDAEIDAMPNDRVARLPQPRGLEGRSA